MKPEGFIPNLDPAATFEEFRILAKVPDPTPVILRINNCYHLKGTFHCISVQLKQEKVKFTVIFSESKIYVKFYFYLDPGSKKIIPDPGKSRY